VKPLNKFTISWTQIHYRLHKSHPLASILSQINPVHTIPSYFSNIHFNIIPNLRQRLLSGLFPSGHCVVSSNRWIFIKRDMNFKPSYSIERYYTFNEKLCCNITWGPRKIQGVNQYSNYAFEILYTEADHNKHINKLCRIFLTITWEAWQRCETLCLYMTKRMYWESIIGKHAENGLLNCNADHDSANFRQPRHISQQMKWSRH
jgi:hypothetical protein